MVTLKQQVIDTLADYRIKREITFVEERGEGRVEVQMGQRLSYDLVEKLEESFDVIESGNNSGGLGWFTVQAKDPAACRRCDGMGSVGFDVRCPDCSGTGEYSEAEPLKTITISLPAENAVATVAFFDHLYARMLNAEGRALLDPIKAALAEAISKVAE